MTAYYDDRRKRWAVGDRKASRREVRDALAAAFKGGAIPCPIDASTTVLVGPDAFVKLDMDGNATGLARTRFG